MLKNIGLHSAHKIYFVPGSDVTAAWRNKDLFGILWYKSVPWTIFYKKKYFWLWATVQQFVSTMADWLRRQLQETCNDISRNNL